MSGITTSWPLDLAVRVEAALAAKGQSVPLERLRTLFETMFFTSLQTEERFPITFHVVYADPENPDPNPPERITPDRWNFVSLSKHLPFTLSSLRKLASATDPRSSSIAVYHSSSGQLFVWGFVDQGNRYFDFITHDSDSGPDRPGLFQASVLGVGKIAAYMGYVLIADLDVDRIRGTTMDALSFGPVLDALLAGLDEFMRRVRSEVGDEIYIKRDHWDASLGFSWLTVLRRLLLRAQQYRHGGAILITPDKSLAELNVKYGLSYNRLRSALHRNGLATMRSTNASDQIYEEHLSKRALNLPARLYRTEVVEESTQEDSASEIDGAIWFVSLLTRVDGLVLLTPDLEVRGFGVEITSTELPNRIVLATDPEASEAGRTDLEYHHFGTRHRSMMRYCAKHPGSVGFVVSQDGDVRVMTLVGGTLAVWENITLRLDNMDAAREGNS